MKKLYLILAMALGLTITSCSIDKQTSTKVHPSNYVSTNVAADLDVAPKRITYTYRPLKSEVRGGTQNVINIAVSKALQANGNADVLVGMEYTTRMKLTLFGKTKIEEVTVTGFPAFYRNFRNLPDSVSTPMGTILVK